MHFEFSYAVMYNFENNNIQNRMLILTELKQVFNQSTIDLC